jgi:hypothetical protein
MNQTLIDIYDENNDIWGLPQEYKSIKFYPIKLIDSKYQVLFYNLFTQPKNYIPDKTILKMSFLKFLLYVIQSGKNLQEETIEKDLIDFLQFITKSKNVMVSWNFEENPKTIEEIKLFVNIENVIFSEYEFENIREIVLQQNGLSIEYVEQYDPEMEKKLITFNRTSKDLSLQDEIYAFCCLTNKTIYDLNEYTLYQFKTHLEKLIYLEDYRLYKPLEASGQIKMQHGNEIKHYLSHINKNGRYDTILVSKDSYMTQSDIFKI